MASHQRNQGWGNPPPNQAASGIEDRLRDLILTHHPPSEDRPGATNPGAFPRLEPSHSRSASTMGTPIPPSGPASNANTQAPGQPLPSSPKMGKRRPNQAQRRQMSAQLMITPDLQPQRQTQAYPARPAPHYQRHMPSQSLPFRPIPPPSPQWRGNDDPRAHETCRGPQHPQAHSSQRSADFSDYPAHQHVRPSANAGRGGYRHPPGSTHFAHRSQTAPQIIAKQAAYLEMLCHPTVMYVEIQMDEIGEKESFRQRIETISRRVIERYERDQLAIPDFPAASVQLKCFGSLASGFATKDSDLDLGLLSPYSRVQPDAPGSPIPRLLEKAFLDAGLGARLLSRTRVPIIKLCESPPNALRQRLLDARARWEAGLENERPDGPEEEPEHDSSSRAEDDGQHQELASGGPDAAPSAGFQVPCRETGRLRTFQLQQKAKGTMASFCALANRVLRRAGGRDVNSSNYKSFSQIDWDILNRVCQAFIDGLFDARLRERISQNPSLCLRDQPRNNYQRSLAGLMTQVEGEHILQSWDDWPDRSHFDNSSFVDDQILKDWRELQSRSPQDMDIFQYARDLEAVLSKIKRIPAIRLLLLEQEEHETPMQYCTRVEKIRGRLDHLNPEIERAIVSRYVSGIHPGDVRDAVAAYLDANPDQLGLQTAACRHRSLSLARDLERALVEKLFEANEAASITRYVEGLRSPLVRGSKRYVVPFPPGSAPAIAALKAFKGLHGELPAQAPSRYRDPLEFPKSGVGVQCDINFSAHLALQNTTLLRCYALTDARVKPMALFVKHWAKVRGINSGYRGTLSSYGYVLMVMHYLVHVAQPFVCPNLQKLAPTAWPGMSPAEIEATTTCKGYDVRFWRNEHEILQLALANQLTQSTASLGELLRGFFEYFANNGPMSTVHKRGFDWGRDVLSLRTHGGLLSKQEKGWTGAKTVFAADGGNTTDAGQSQSQDVHQQASSRNADAAAAAAAAAAASEGDQQPKAEQSTPKSQHVKEIRLRYLFAIEDPFEVDHNVARTVTHNGIVSIRDEFRRAWRILQAVGHDKPADELLKDAREEAPGGWDELLRLLEDIHGCTGLTGV